MTGLGAVRVADVEVSPVRAGRRTEPACWASAAAAAAAEIEPRCLRITVKSLTWKRGTPIAVARHQIRIANDLARRRRDGLPPTPAQLIEMRVEPRHNLAALPAVVLTDFVERRPGALAGVTV